MDRVLTLHNVPITKNGKTWKLGKFGMIKFEELKKEYDSVVWEVAYKKKIHNLNMWNANIVFYGEKKPIEKKPKTTLSKTKAMQVVRQRTIADVQMKVKLKNQGDSIKVPCTFTKKQVEWFINNGMIVKVDKGYTTIINTIGSNIRHQYK